MRMVRAGRRGVLLTAVPGSGLVLLRAGLPLLHAPTSFAEAVSASCTVLALGAWSWLVAGVVGCWLAARRGRSTAPAWTPRLARLLVAAALGVALPTAEATADTTDLLHGLPLPGRPVAAEPTAAAHPPAPRAPHATASRTTVVRAGDCLWSLAARRLDDPTPAAVDRAWRAVYRANRARVGPDPDLLRPGTRLVLPRSLAPTPPPGDLR